MFCFSLKLKTHAQNKNNKKQTPGKTNNPRKTFNSTAFSKKSKISQPEKARDEDVKPSSALKTVRCMKANCQHSQTPKQCCSNDIYSHLQTPENCMTRRQSLQLFLFIVQFVKVACQICYITCINSPLSAVIASQNYFTAPSTQWLMVWIKSIHCSHSISSVLKQSRYV